jgi:sec-independent protein translocase protein TatA
MFRLGIGELLVIHDVLVIFGAGELPEIGEGLGRRIRSFRKEVRKPDEIDVTPKLGGESGAGDHDPGSGQADAARATSVETSPPMTRRRERWRRTGQPPGWTLNSGGGLMPRQDRHLVDAEVADRASSDCRRR